MTFFVNIFGKILYNDNSTNVIQYIYIFIYIYQAYAALETRMKFPRLLDQCTICDHILTLNASAEGASAIFKGIPKF